MRIFAELEPSAYEEIEELVQEGKYESVDQFLRVAAQNQLAIERSQENGQAAPTQTTDSESGGTHYQWEYTSPQNIPTGYPFDEERERLLLFSQYYRFFPLKCALYYLAELTYIEERPVSIDQAQEYIADEIWPVQKEIHDWEETNDIKKQNKRSTGLPNDQEGSMSRYLTHYVGKVQTQKERPTGFPHDLGYVSFEQDGMDWSIQLSDSGAEFVRLTNPLLDNGPEAPTLSEEEQALVVETLRERLDLEYEFMKFIFSVLEQAEGSYTDHIDEYRQFISESEAISGELSENRVRSQVAGSISRMVELGILERGRRRGWYEPRRHPDEFESVSLQA